MKKIIFIFVFLSFSCSSNSEYTPISNTDNSSNTEDDTSDTSSFDEDLIGTWAGIINDSDVSSEGLATIILNTDGTGSRRVLWPSDPVEIIYSELTWSATATSVTLTYALNEGSEVLAYNLINQDIVEITNDVGEKNVIYRLNLDLVGTWKGVLVDSDDNSEGEVIITFNQEGTGIEEIVWPPYEGEKQDITWATSATEINILYDSGEGEKLVLGYSFIDNNTVELSVEGESVNVYRQ